ncbi:sensor domain-containing diguanylate cyclase [Phreatobacter sp. AB_2022a]|uniref:sensor domain-containing diguanylate cyclase n=1 Tax=Phreatobacter sp. AB_2022a TaxID=3003134 RepID=UPI0022870A6E|nr:GGDEF domain-containing protein [Phreatobacter sp. AB_2022a]MCZ0734639.1 GGDEF domain-containing protein [Phreatobacter sp. AB_2022a]
MDFLKASAIRIQAAPRLRLTWSLGALALLLAIGALIMPLAARPVSRLPAFMLAYGVTMVVLNALLATLFLCKATASGQSRLNILAAAYIFVVLMMMPAVFSFPDAIVAGSIIGNRMSAIYLWIAWHYGFGLAAVWYLTRSGADHYRAGPILLGTLAVAAATVVGVTLGAERLPDIFVDGVAFGSPALKLVPVSLLALALAGFVLSVQRAHTAEDAGLAVGLGATCLDIWLSFYGGPQYSAGWYAAKVFGLTASVAVLAALCLEITRLYLNAAKANEVLRRLAERDGLTQLFNRRHFDEQLAEQWGLASRSGQAISVIMIDIDWFKSYNDTYGHQVGDLCLRAVGLALIGVSPDRQDFVSRYGGEEFVVLVPAADASGAAAVAEEIRAAVARLAVPHRSSPKGRVTVSVGAFTMVAEGARPDLIMRRADECLYEAKARGRDQVVSASAIVPPVRPDNHRLAACAA